MSKQDKVQTYMTSILANPKFLEWAAKRYGQLQTSGEGLVCDVAVGQLATAIAHLERQLNDLVQGDTSN
jgi:hypothetical protein